MEIVTTHTEAEALLLEANLIKRLKPRFNIVLRDDKSYPWLMLAEDHPFPQLLKHRGAKTTKGIYFGPFASAGAVNRTLNTLQRAFLLRSLSGARGRGAAMIHCRCPAAGSAVLSWRTCRHQRPARDR